MPLFDPYVDWDAVRKRSAVKRRPPPKDLLWNWRRNTYDGEDSVGPYSHCVKAGSTYYLCGQVPFHPVTGEVVGNGMKEQAVQTLANMKAVLEAAGLTVTDIAKTTVFVTNMDDFAAFNEVYAAFMGEHRPARVCVEVSNIAHGCLLEMDAICFKE